MDWDNEQICHLFRLTAVGLGEYVQVFRGMFVKLGITGKESAVSLFLLVRERGGPRFKFNFYFLGGGHLKYLYLCGGTPKIIKILVVDKPVLFLAASNSSGLYEGSVSTLTSVSLITEIQIGIYHYKTEIEITNQSPVMIIKCVKLFCKYVMNNNK
jgi:hypothetical protein